MSTVYVQGRCPACLTESLVLDGDHHIVCDGQDCPAPTAVAQLLEATASPP